MLDYSKRSQEGRTKKTTSTTTTKQMEYIKQIANDRLKFNNFNNFVKCKLTKQALKLKAEHYQNEFFLILCY